MSLYPSASVIAASTIAAAVVAAAVATLVVERSTQDKPPTAEAEPEKLPTNDNKLTERRKLLDDGLALSRYFDLEAHPFKHAALLAGCENNVLLVLDRIHVYALSWIEKVKKKYQNVEGFVSAKKLGSVRIVGDIDAAVGGHIAPDVVVGKGSLVVAEGAKVLGGYVDVSNGDVYLGPRTTVEPGAALKGPAIFGADCQIRSGAYIRGDVVAGDNISVRGELKNALILDHAEICHTSYVGDSVLGFKAHLAAHAVTANLPLLAPAIKIQGAESRRKFGAIIGDHAQLGAAAVTSPASFLAKNTHVYPLVHLRPGFYGPHTIIKGPGTDEAPFTSISLENPTDRGSCT